MKRVLEIADKLADEAEILFLEEKASSLTIEDSKLRDIEGTINSGYALRLIKDGKIGSAFTRNLINREELVKNALNSLIGNVKADYSFPEPAKIKEFTQFSKETESLTYTGLLDKCNDAIHHFEGKVEGQINCYSGSGIRTRKIMNTHGVDHVEESSMFYSVPALVYPGTHTSIMNIFMTVAPQSLTHTELQDQLDLYTSSLPEVEIGSSKMKVMFMPGAFTGLIWRLNAGTNGKNFYEKSSPLVNKVGDKIISDKITVTNDPFDLERPGACAFDDEGVAARKLDIIKDGVLETCFVDLDYADKLNMEPTGTGFRETLWGEDGVSIPIIPNPKHMRIQPGKETYKGLLGMMDEGVIALDMIGYHSGNILNGDFSMGMNPGLYVKNGEIIGRVKDGMVAGNVYDMLSNVLGVEDRIHDKNGRPHPCVLFDDVAVSAK